MSGSCFGIDHFSRPGPFPPRSPPPLLTALFEPFNGTMDPSDSSCLPDRLCSFELPSPARGLATAGDRRSPRFRRVPFRRDVVSDPGRVTAPRIAVPPMLPSTFPTGSASAIGGISWLNPTPHRIAVYASPGLSPSPTQHSLPGDALPSYPGRTCTGWNAPASPGALKTAS